MSASLAGSPLAALRVAWPTWGLWWVEARPAQALAASGRVALDVAGTAFSGTVVSGGTFDGQSAYRLVAGAGGVGKPLPRRGYVNDAGVSLANVLADAAREAGEVLVTAGLTTRLGPHYARAEGTTLGDLLNRHSPQAWYADPDGTLRIGTRAATTYAGTAPRTRVSPAAQAIDLAVDSLAGLAPGVQIDGSLPATDLEINLTPERLTVTAYAGAWTNKRHDAYRRIVRALFPTLAYAGSWEYRVVTQTGKRLNLQPARVASGMPNLANVPMRPGIPGADCKVQLGELVLVVFADGDPSRPCVVAHDAPDAPGWMPLELSLGGPLALGVARQTDTVQAGPFAGVITGGSARIKASL